MFVLCISGPAPTVSKGTHIIIPLVEELKGDRWEAAVVEQDGKRIKLLVNSPPTAVIGRYHLLVETNSLNGGTTPAHDPANDIFLLFNPWCEGKDKIKHRLNWGCFVISQTY